MEEDGRNNRPLGDPNTVHGKRRRFPANRKTVRRTEKYFGTGQFPPYPDGKGN